ncbi:hypothetical protein PGTUg99_015217 [Puccinia graminis f. sp. tritici]|uniref:Uncharacterized protein n=1 Tax=Puccinia graminis f. sp. tritici TaxID=56615 RepID=A0A5B0NDJ1_PUCGR|nr:hypothetical protein PGTUg99_015217 [Puccinia graminis f. sp. tritici]
MALRYFTSQALLIPCGNRRSRPVQTNLIELRIILSCRCKAAISPQLAGFIRFKFWTLLIRSWCDNGTLHRCRALAIGHPILVSKPFQIPSSCTGEQRCNRIWQQFVLVSYYSLRERKFFAR